MNEAYKERLLKMDSGGLPWWSVVTNSCPSHPRQLLTMLITGILQIICFIKNVKMSKIIFIIICYVIYVGNARALLKKYSEKAKKSKILNISGINSSMKKM